MVSVGSTVRALYSKLFSLSNYFLVGLVLQIFISCIGRKAQIWIGLSGYPKLDWPSMNHDFCSL